MSFSSTADVQVPVRSIDLLHGRMGCTNAKVCEKFRGQFMRRMVGKYVGENGVCKKQLQSAIIDLHDFDIQKYMQAVKDTHKGAALRQARKADRAGLICKPFVWKNFIPDIVEINQSKPVRSGGEMKPAYRRSVEDLGGAPTKFIPLEGPACPVHTTHCWGCFVPTPGHAQGEIVVNEQLVAYIKFKRNGNYAVYTSILGHGDYLEHGIMYRLHHTIMQWVGENLTGSLKGLEFIMYGAVESGAEGLQQWKKRGLFEPAYLVLNESKGSGSP